MGLSPVHLAVIFKRANILQWLLDLGAEPDERDEFGGLPIHKAAFVGSLPCLELLVNKRAFVKAQGLPYLIVLLVVVSCLHMCATDRFDRD